MSQHPALIPPASPLPSLLGVVEFSVVVSGSVSDFGASQINALKAEYAARYSLSPDQVEVKVEVNVVAASVRIRVQLKVSSMEEATALTVKVNDSPDHESILVSAGITATIESFTTASAAPAAQLQEAGESSSSPVSSQVGIIAGVIGGFLVVLLIGVLIVRSRSR